MKKFLSILSISVIILFSLCTGYFLHQYGKTSNLQEIYFIVPKNSTVEQIANKLKQQSLIKSKSYFVFIAKIFKLENNVQGENLIIKPKTSFKELVNKLKDGKSDFSIITVPEGYTLYQIANKLEKNNLAKVNKFINVKASDIDSSELIPTRSNVLYELEGYLFPETYYIPVDSDELDIAKLMFKDFKKIFSEEYVLRAKELNLSVNEVITVASLIEKEAANNEERSRIAGVIYNRLKKGMLLQIDAAVIYANTKGEKTLGKVLYSDLKVESKYNTYLYKGLPPGPIASPGKASIHAALYPENHDYLYYVVGEKGHVFSKTYDEHLKNVKKHMKGM